MKPNELTPWTADRSRRRIKLIDKSFVEHLTLEEALELDQLTLELREAQRPLFEQIEKAFTEGNEE